MECHFPVGFGDLDFENLGIPRVEQYIKEYCQRMGTDSVGNWEFYVAFICFRFAAILQGVYKRALQGKEYFTSSSLISGKHS